MARRASTRPKRKSPQSRSRRPASGARTATAKEDSGKPEKITLEEWRRMCLDPEVPDERIASYSLFEPGEVGFEVVMRPNPALVEATSVEHEFENAMAAGNRLARFRRGQTLNARLRNPRFKDLPLLVSEGDSWFQFPFLVREVIDHLGSDFNIASCGAAGDTAFNMVFRDIDRRPPEYLRELRKRKGQVKAFLFSAAGNDILGEIDGKRVLQSMLVRPTTQNPGVADVIDPAALGRQLGAIERAYRTVVDTVRREPGLERLPIVFHGYDYSLAYPADGNDKRAPVHAARDQWLGSSFREKGIDGQLRHDVVRHLIDALYDLLGGIAGKSSVTGVYVVNCRDTLTTSADWIDEIHGTTDGFRKIAGKFKRVIRRAIRNAES